MHQHPQIPLVVLVILASRSQEVGHGLDLRGQNRNLHLGRPSICSNALLPLGNVRLWPDRVDGLAHVLERRRARWKDPVCVVSTKSLDTPCDVDAHPVLAGSVLQCRDTRNSLDRTFVVLLVLCFDFFCRLLYGSRLTSHAHRTNCGLLGDFT